MIQTDGGRTLENTQSPAQRTTLRRLIAMLAVIAVLSGTLAAASMTL